MKYIYIDKNNKQIRMESQKKMDLPQFDIIKVSNNEMFDGHTCWYRDGKVIKNKLTVNKKEQARGDLQKAQTIDELKIIINNLL